MRNIALMLICSMFVSTVAFADVNSISYDLRRLANAQEDENRLQACLSRVNLYSPDELMMREMDCVKFIASLAKGKKRP